MAGGLASLRYRSSPVRPARPDPDDLPSLRPEGGIVAALGPYVTTKAGLIPDPMPDTLDDIGGSVRAVYHNLDEMDVDAQAAMASQLAGRSGRVCRCGAACIGCHPPERARADDDDVGSFTDLSVVLLSSGTYRVQGLPGSASTRRPIARDGGSKRSFAGRTAPVGWDRGEEAGDQRPRPAGRCETLTRLDRSSSPRRRHGPVDRRRSAAGSPAPWAGPAGPRRVRRRRRRPLLTALIEASGQVLLTLAGVVASAPPRMSRTR
jgi:hypothetical protein